MKVILFTVLVLILKNVNLKLKPDRIGGGMVVKKGQFPFFVQFNWTFNEITQDLIMTQKTGCCGGSLLHRKWVLSAAHCFDMKSLEHLEENESLLVFIGTNIRFDQNAVMNVIKKVHKHPRYYTRTNSEGNLIKMENDIALCLLKYSYTYNNFIRPIYLPSRINDLQKWKRQCGNGTIVGIGMINHYHQFNEKVLYAKVHPLLHEHIFPSELLLNQTFDSKVRYLEGHALRGDSGGPFICNNDKEPVVYGIISAITEHRYTFEIETHFERVDVHLDFIYENVPQAFNWKPGGR